MVLNNNIHVYTHLSNVTAIVFFFFIKDKSTFLTFGMHTFTNSKILLFVFFFKFVFTFFA